MIPWESSKSQYCVNKIQEVPKVFCKKELRTAGSLINVKNKTYSQGPVTECVDIKVNFSR